MHPTFASEIQQKPYHIMKILVVDDQQLVLLSLEKWLTDLGYNVTCADNVAMAIEKYYQVLPDLVIADMNMPAGPLEQVNALYELTEKAPGLDLLKWLKQERKETTPVLILSGNHDEEIIERGFELGANDYMKKPLSLNEIGIRVRRLIGGENKTEGDAKKQFIQNICVGIVIPCYNEEKRLLSDEFKAFVHQNLGYHLCFVNDGSKDNTLEVLQELRKGYESHISIYNCEKNGGKAEAVRLGMLHLAKQEQFEYVGFLDADLSTDFEDFQDLVTTLKNSDKYKVVSGSRISRMGANITKDGARKIISKAINFYIRKTLGMEFRDTQCGAKIMEKDVVLSTFKLKFITRWLFDVEIFMRMKRLYGNEKAQEMLCEKPLNRWVHADGSKLSMKDSFKIVGQIGRIGLYYR